MKYKACLLSLLLATSLYSQTEEEAEAFISKAFMELAKPDNLKEFKKMREDKNLIEDEFLNLNSFEIATNPERLKLNDTNFITIHPEFPKTVIFSNARITDLTAYPTGGVIVMMDENNYNTIEIKTANNLKKGVVVVKYLDKSGKRKITNILIDSYNSKSNKKLFLTTILNDYSQLPAIEIVKSYQKLHKTAPVHNSSIVINDEVYRFIEDNVNGFVTIGNKKFKIEHNFK